METKYEIGSYDDDCNSDVFGDNSSIGDCNSCGRVYEMSDLLSYDRCPHCDQPNQLNTTN